MSLHYSCLRMPPMHTTLQRPSILSLGQRLEGSYWLGIMDARCLITRFTTQHGNILTKSARTLACRNFRILQPYKKGLHGKWPRPTLSGLLENMNLLPAEDLLQKSYISCTPWDSVVLRESALESQVLLASSERACLVS